MKKQLLTLCGLALVAGMSQAQELKTGYVTFPNPQQLNTYVSAWNGGGGTISVDGATWEDEEFFTSRIKPRTRVSETEANIRDFGDYSGRRMLYWVPLGNSDTQGLPNGKFDSEAFSTWSYLDHYGSFTSPFGWVAGAFADAAHKNGVAVSGIASVPQSITSEWGSALTAYGSAYGSDTKAQTLGKFLLYHGTDGLAYNSEWSSTSYSPTSMGLLKMHEGLYKYMADKNPIFENIWYDGTTDSGGCSFDSALENKTGIYKASSIFSNYNWNNTSKLSAAPTRANSVTGVDGSIRGPWWNYAGCNYEGGEPSGTNYTYLPSYKWSVGYWGAHSVNMIWANRNGGGSSTEACQLYYQHQHEMFFGNGKRNPAIDMDIVNIKSHRPSETFHGASKYINERSPLTHVIADEPFYTFFNLGNGKFFNWKGERLNDKEWYSLGVQDFMPTWRWWFAPKWMQKTVTDAEVANQLEADFTYEDAYVGGSCLKITGSTSKEYLHLFKSSITPAAGQKITVRFKLLNGQGDVRLVMTGTTSVATETTPWKTMKLFTVATSDDITDQSYEQGWVEKTWTINSAQAMANMLPGGKIGAIGLEFVNAKDLELLIGELSIMTSNNTTTPSVPKIKSSKVLDNNFKGVDGKIIWTMDNDAALKAGTPKYNSDVNASMYKVWSREGTDGEAKFVGVTTSWAAIAFQAPNTDSSKKIQFGVSAVSADTKTESAIAWGSEFSKGTYTGSDEIQIDKRTIKKNEGFEISYIDQTHSASNWILKNAAGTTVASASNTKVFSVPNGLSAEGGYDLVIDSGTSNERTFGYYVQVSSEAVGALPRLDDLKVNGTSVTEASANIKINITDEPILSYEGRYADGSASRADALNGHCIGAEVADLGLAATSRQSFSIAGWYKFNEIPDHSGGWAFINSADKMNAAWPLNEWGWCWNTADKDGAVELVYRGNTDGASPGELHYTFPDLRLQAQTWYHIVLVHEYSGTSFRALLYVNGVKQKGYWWQYAKGNTVSARSVNGTKYGWTCKTCGKSSTDCGHKSNSTWVGNTSCDTYVPQQTYALTAGSQIYFGGPKYQGGVIDGIVDDFQVWDKAMTEDEIKQSMNGYGNGTLPSGLLALWDFESDADADNYIQSRGRKTVGLKTYDVEGGESNRVVKMFAPSFESGCPFLTGTAFPIVTKATWKDGLDRKTVFTKQETASRAAVTEGEAGAVKVTFKKAGDHDLTVTLSNDYGTASKSFPIYEVNPQTTAIDGIEADGSELNTYTIDRIFFLEFGQDGNYDVEVYNMAGMLVAKEGLNVVAGQNAQIDLGNSGVYLVKVVKDGQVLRTLKILTK